jgi:hypothetical protein
MIEPLIRIPRPRKGKTMVRWTVEIICGDAVEYAAAKTWAEQNASPFKGEPATREINDAQQKIVYVIEKNGYDAAFWVSHTV